MKTLIAILIILFPMISYACKCADRSEDIDAIYENASGIYRAVISKIETTDAERGRARLNIELAVLKMYKGDTLDKISVISESPLTSIDSDGSFVTSKSSCDVVYFINQEYLLALYGNEELSLSRCSENRLLINPQNLKRLEELKL